MAAMVNSRASSACRCLIEIRVVIHPPAQAPVRNAAPVAIASGRNAGSGGIIPRKTIYFTACTAAAATAKLAALIGVVPDDRISVAACGPMLPANPEIRLARAFAAIG